MITGDNLLTIHRFGLTIESDRDHPGKAGVFFEDGQNPPVQARLWRSMNRKPSR